jgi:hypothetical protein
MTDTSCENRIDESMLNFERQCEYVFRKLQEDEFDEDDEYDVDLVKEFESDYDEIGDPYEAIDQFALGVSVERSIKIELSWGGPSSYIRATFDTDGYVITASYHFLDWFDGSSRGISRDSYMMQYVEHTIQTIIESEV